MHSLVGCKEKGKAGRNPFLSFRHMDSDVRIGWLADLWLFITPTKRRAVCTQFHLRVTAAQAILKNLG